MKKHPRIVCALSNVHMNLSHDGLRELVWKAARVNTMELGDGELVLFLNRKRDKMKVIGSQAQVLAYVKLNDGRRLPLEAIQYIPQTFAMTGKIDLDHAIATSVRESFGKKNGGAQVELLCH